MQNTFKRVSDVTPGTSVVGKKITVDLEGNGNDFKIIYTDFDPNGTFTITEDNLGLPLDNSGIRVISFKDDDGHKGSGNASRFLLVPEDNL